MMTPRTVLRYLRWKSASRQAWRLGYPFIVDIRPENLTEAQRYAQKRMFP